MQKYLNLLDNLSPMGIFWNKKPVKSTYDERLATLEEEVRKLKRETLGHTMDLETMRDKVLRKIQRKQKTEDLDELETNGNIPQDGFEDVRKIKVS